MKTPVRRTTNLAQRYHLNNPLVKQFSNTAISKETPLKSQERKLINSYEKKKITLSPYQFQEKIQKMQRTNTTKRYSVQDLQIFDKGSNSINLDQQKLYQRDDRQKYYLYWKQKAFEYQNKNFILDKQNNQLRHQVSLMKQQIYQLQHIVPNYQILLKKNQCLENQIKQLTQSQNRLQQHMSKLEKYLSNNKAIANNYQKKIINRYPQNQQKILKQLKIKVEKLQAQNIQYHYIVKEYQQYFKENGIQSIWNSHTKYITQFKSNKNLAIKKPQSISLSKILI